MTRVAEETEDDSWVDAFRVAYEHHLNFYNDGMTAQDIDDDRLIVTSFVDLLLAAAWEGDRCPCLKQT